MKTLGVGIVLMVALFFCLPYHLYMKQLWKKNPEKSWEKARRFVSGFFRFELKLSGCKVNVIGKENIPQDGPVLFVGNHRSYFDILIYHEAIGKPLGFLAKKEMEKIPLLSTWMKNLYCLFLDRDNMREGLKTILQAIDYVKNGISICIFPEGTRNNGEELSMLPFRDGALKIAEKTGCAIIPISMNNTADIFEAHFPRVKKVHVVIEYGKPIYPKELDKETRKHLGIYCHDLIQDTIKKNASLV